MAITKLTEKTIEQNPSSSTNLVITHPVPVDGGTKESVRRLTAEDAANLFKDLSGTADDIEDLKSAIDEKGSDIEISVSGTSLVINTSLVDGNEVSY